MESGAFGDLTAVTPISHNSSNSREPPTPQEWESVRPVVRHLYVSSTLPLKDVRHILERDHGFRNASERMFKSRLKAWGYLKNAKKDDWAAIAILHRTRVDIGKKHTIFKVRGRARTVKDLQKYIRSLSMTDDEFLRESQEQGIQIPDYIRAETLEPESPAKDSPASSAQEFSTPSPRYPPPSGLRGDSQLPNPPHAGHSSGASHLSPPDLSHFSLNLPSATHVDHEASSATIPTTTTDAMSTDHESAATTPPCDQFQRDVETISHQMLSPSPLRSCYGADDIDSYVLVTALTPDSDASSSDSPNFEFRCSRCQQPYSMHFASLDAFVPSYPPRSQTRPILNADDSSPAAAAAWQLPTSTRSDEGAWRWVARSFLACMNLSCGNERVAYHSLVDAGSEFEHMLLNEDPLILTATQLVATMLAMHGQNEIARRVLHASLEVCERLRPADDPVRMIVALWTHNAKDGDLAESGIHSDLIKGVYEQLSDKYGKFHPYTIQGSYSYGWLLKWEGEAEASETVLADTYDRACSTFCPEHLQSIFALASLAGAQLMLGKRTQAMAHFETVIRTTSSTLGMSHPYTLEAKRRLASLILEQEVADKLDIPGLRVEQLYWEVLVGRVKMLGRQHDYTQAMQVDYEKVCKDRGTWEARESAVRLLFHDQGTVRPHRKVEKGSGGEIESGSLHEAY